jgi:MoxR-like ATPase
MSDLETIEQLRSVNKSIRKELKKVIVGQDDVLDQLLMAVFAGGHCILEGVPGLAKTLLISSLAKTMNLTFCRIQFTPDLMPSDITGTEVMQENRSTGEREFRFLSGPVFANIILADEINRTGPKTQAALLEAMQEKQVTVAGNAHRLDLPFFVLATQNPIEQEGTYPLPEAQQDRFFFKVLVDYPSVNEEFDIIKMTTTDIVGEPNPVIDGPTVLKMQAAVRSLPVADDVIRYATTLVRKTRVNTGEVDPQVREWISWGAGPRASQTLILAAKTRAALDGRLHVAADDVAAVLAPALRHRIAVNFAAESEGMTSDKVLMALLQANPPHQSPVSQKVESF